MAVFPTHPTFLFPRLKIKLKGHHFDKIEVIEAILITLTENDLQYAFKKWQKRWKRCILTGRELLLGRWWPEGPKSVFYLIAAPVTVIIGGSLWFGRSVLIIFRKFPLRSANPVVRETQSELLKCDMSYFTEIVHNVYLSTILDVTQCSLVDMVMVTN
jgi:hypothetical protein